MNPHSLWIRNFKMNRPGFCLRADDVVLNPGERLLVQAPSGFGKSSFLRGLAGFDPVEGEIGLGAHRIDGLPPEKRNFGILFQDQLLFPHLNAVENVMIGLSLRRYPKRESCELATAALSELGLSHRIHARITELSGGERQRVALLRAIIFKPAALFLDEPYRGLDDDSKEKMQRYLSNHLQQHPIPVVIISHQFESSEVQLSGENMQHERFFRCSRSSR